MSVQFFRVDIRDAPAEWGRQNDTTVVLTEAAANKALRSAGEDDGAGAPS